MLTSKVISEVENSRSVIKLEDGNKEEKSRKNKISPQKNPKLAEFSQDSPFISQFQQHSHLLMALIEPDTLKLRYANDYFCRMIGIEPTFNGDVSSMEIKLFSLFLDLDQATREHIYRRHLLHLIFRDIYQIDLYYQRLLDEPVMASLSSPIYSEPRLIQFWLRCDQLQVSRIDPQLDEFADLNLGQMSVAETARLIDSVQLEELEQRLQLENYQLDGLIILEGIDVTIQETIRRIEQRLIDRESIFKAEKFQELSQQMRSLFRANNSLILRAEGEQAQLSISGEVHTLRPILSSMQSLQGSHFLRAAKANRVWNVSDLALDCQTDYERDLLERGIRSLLLIPIIARTTASGKFSRQLMGLLGLTSDGIDHMIYVGASIEHTFSPFHLHSLRYEQLRAVCESARTAFSLKELYKTELQLTHLILVQDTPVDIFHDEKTEKLFDVRGTSDTRYEIVKKRLDKGVDAETHTRITQPGMLTIVYSTEDEWEEYQQYVRYLVRDGLIDGQIEFGNVAPLQGVTGLKFARVRVLQ